MNAISTFVLVIVLFLNNQYGLPAQAVDGNTLVIGNQAFVITLSSITTEDGYVLTLESGTGLPLHDVRSFATTIACAAYGCGGGTTETQEQFYNRICIGHPGLCRDDGKGNQIPVTLLGMALIPYELFIEKRNRINKIMLEVFGFEKHTSSPYEDTYMEWYTSPELNFCVMDADALPYDPANTPKDMADCIVGAVVHDKLRYIEGVRDSALLVY